MMMKKILILASLVILLSSCGSYNSIDSFYNAHKNDANVTAFQAPRFMLSTLGNLIPEMNSVFGNVKDLRYIQLSHKNELDGKKINMQINNLTSSSFVEVFRKNEDTKRTLVTLRERKDVVKEIIVYKNDNVKNSIFYLNGDFNPIKVRQFAKENKFDSLINTLTHQYKWNTPSTSPILN